MKSCSDLHEAIAQTRSRIKLQHRSADLEDKPFPAAQKMSKTQRSLHDHLRAFPESLDLRFYPLEKTKPKKQTVIVAKKSEAVLLQNKLAFQKVLKEKQAKQLEVQDRVGERSHCCGCAKAYEYTIQKLCVSLQHVRQRLAYLAESVSSLTKQVEELKLKNVLQVSPVEAPDRFGLCWHSGPKD